MKPKKSKPYNPEIELAKGATLEVASYDRTQKIKVVAGKVTVGGLPGRTEITGTATGKTDSSINGTISLWLSIFRYMRQDGTTNHVAGWNITVPLAPNQAPSATAKALADHINAGSRPYRATAINGGTAAVKIVFTEK